MDGRGPDGDPNEQEEKPTATIAVPQLPGAVVINPWRERTRVVIALGLTVVVAILFLALAFRLLFDSAPMPPEHLDTYKTTLGLLVGIYGAVVGFYFGASGQA